MTIVGHGPGSTQVKPPRRLLVQPLRATTTPGRLRLLLVSLVALSLIWGAVAAWTANQRTSAAGAVVGTSEPLSLDGQRIYRSLSDADATAATAFLSGGLEPLAARHRYLADIAEAASSLESATAVAGQSANARLAAESGQATGLPSIAIALVVAIIVGYALYRAQRWLSGRTHRVVNFGLAVASVAGAVSVLWLIIAFTVARVELGQAHDHGSAPVEALAQAEIAALQAHADESLTLIDNSGDDSFQADFTSVRTKLGPGPGTLLTVASSAAGGSPGSGYAAAAAADATAWYAAHQRVRSQDDSGAHSQAVQSAIGSAPGDSAAAFGRLDSALSSGIAADQVVFHDRAVTGRDAATGLEAGLIVLSLIMAAGCARGLTQRLAEYR